MNSLIKQHNEVSGKIKGFKVTLLFSIVLAVVAIFLSEEKAIIISFVSLAVALSFILGIFLETKKKVIEEIKKEALLLPIERIKVDKIKLIESREGWSKVYMEFENGNLSTKKVTIVKTNIKESFLEGRKFPEGLSVSKEITSLLPLPILFVPKEKKENYDC